jgi:hypothetical protein
MPCVFCGGPRVTNEHVFPQWLNRYLPPGRLQQIEQTRYGPGEYDITRLHIGLDFRIRKVCARCNNGWLSRLETESVDILDPLISSLKMQLLPLAAQRQIALWATKTAMMVDNTQVDPILPTMKLARMRSHRAIPGGTRIWIGACAELYPLVTNHTVRIDLENLEKNGERFPGGFYAPMKIGHLCLYVYFPMGDNLVIQLAPRHHLGLARIWPRRASDLPWPPPWMPRDGSEFEAFADLLYRNLGIFDVDRARRFGIKES